MIYVVDEDQERIDRIAGKLFGTPRGGALEWLLKANPGMAAEGAYLPRGTRIVVPTRPDRQPDPTLIRPWD